MLRAVLDFMPDNISIKDLQGNYIFDNSSHCRFLGATTTVEVVGKTLDFLPARLDLYKEQQPVVGKPVGL